MGAEQRFLEIRKIFNEVIAGEVKKYLENSESKITRFEASGSMIFCNKYELCGNGHGSNDVIDGLKGLTNDVPIFYIHHNNTTFTLMLQHMFINRWSSCFSEVSDGEKEAKIWKNEEMLENEEFKEIFLQMMKDIAPERLEEVQKLLFA